MKENIVSLKQITIQAYAENNKTELDEENFRILLDSSIYGMFGILEANKIKYSVKREGSMRFTLKTYDK